MNWARIGTIFGAIGGVLTLLGVIGTASVWALESHFDDRYIMVAESLQGQLFRKQEEIFRLKLKKDLTEDDRKVLEFLKLQEQQLKQQLGQ